MEDRASRMKRYRSGALVFAASIAWTTHAAIPFDCVPCSVGQGSTACQRAEPKLMHACGLVQRAVAATGSGQDRCGDAARLTDTRTYTCYGGNRSRAAREARAAIRALVSPPERVECLVAEFAPVRGKVPDA